MKCGKCGAENVDTNAFCDNCGAYLEDTVTGENTGEKKEPVKKKPPKKRKISFLCFSEKRKRRIRPSRQPI